MKLDILAIGVHPDDVELAASGTLLKHIALDYKVGLLDLTRGELGSRGTAKTRDAEAEDARQIMGAVVRENLRMEDGLFVHNEENLRAIIKVLRKYQPDIVLLNAVRDRHPDHGRAAKLCADACFYSGLLKIETLDDKGKPQVHWRPKAVYHYIQDQFEKPDFVVDISPFMEQKMELILAYKTQFFNPAEAIEGVKTPISGKDFYEYLYAKDRVSGRAIQVEFAESFQTMRTPGVKDLFDLI